MNDMKKLVVLCRECMGKSETKNKEKLAKYLENLFVEVYGVLEPETQVIKYDK